MPARDKVWKKLTFSAITTSKIRVAVNNALNNRSRIVELEAWGTAMRANAALAANGGVVSYSSQDSPYLGTFANDSEHLGYVSGQYTFWRDNTNASFPDWLQVDFNGSKSIDEIDIYTVQDNAETPTEPVANTTTFSLYGVTDFDVQYWNGSNWVTVPDGSVTGNNKVWKKLTFSAITTSKIRVTVNNALNNRSRIVELEAWTVGGTATTAGINWLVTDQLGTPRMIFDESGSLANVKRHDYLPFGEEMSSVTGLRSSVVGFTGDAIRQKFTSKERDNETGLDYSINRYYSNVQGRFTSVDPENAGAYAGNPQTWNGYSYGLNNPMLYSDPDGLKVRVCGTDGQCTDSDTDLTDEQWNKWFGGDKSIKAKGGNIYKNGELIGTYQQLSCDSCLYDIHSLGRQITASDPGGKALKLWGGSVIAGGTLPSAAAGYIAIGVFTVLVPPPGEDGALLVLP